MKKKSFKNLLNRSSFVFPDGSGIKIACKIMSKPLKQNLNGTDMFPYICHMAQKEGIKIFLYGAKEGIASKMRYNILQRFPSLKNCRGCKWIQLP